MDHIHTNKENVYFTTNSTMEFDFQKEEKSPRYEFKVTALFDKAWSIKVEISSKGNSLLSQQITMTDTPLTIGFFKDDDDIRNYNVFNLGDFFNKDENPFPVNERMIDLSTASESSLNIVNNICNWKEISLE